MTVINAFPSVVGSYPGSNHANACGSEVYYDPVLKKDSKLYSSCPGVGDAITACQKSGKKVMLSLGGGWPTDYYLPSPEVATWTAQFLIGAYGPPTAAWKAAGRPRPFGDAVVDGFDLDLEAQTYDMPSAEYIYKNYDVFGKYVKSNSKMLLSAAPQCVVPDVRISPVLKAVPFDFIFTQFYNTRICSAAQAVQDIKDKKTSTFTFDKWISEIKASANPNLKFYIGLAAGPDGLPTHKEDYLTPEDANTLITKYKDNKNFGGVMLWEASVSVRNPTYGQSYGTWMKYAVQGTFLKNYHPIVSSSTRSSTTSTKTSSTKTPSSTPVTSTKTSSTKSSSTKISSSTPISSSKISSSTPVSSSKIPSSTPTPSTMITSSKTSSSAYVTSSMVSSSAYVTSSSISSSSSSSSAYETVSTKSASSAETVSSTLIEPSSIATISASASSSESAYVPYPTESASSVETISSSATESSSIDTISATKEGSSVYVPYPTETPSSVETVSSTFIEPSSIATISASETVSSSVYVPSSETSASTDKYPTDTVSATTPEGVSSTSCSTSSVAYSTGASSSDVYSVSSVVYSSGVYSTASPVYPTSTYSASKGADYPEYPAESSKSDAESSTGYESVPSVTKKPEYSEYPSAPTGSTTATVITSKFIASPNIHLLFANI
jgi:chitinase